MSSVRVAYTGYHEIQTWLLFKFLEKLSTEEEDEREREGGGDEGRKEKEIAWKTQIEYLLKLLHATYNMRLITIFEHQINNQIIIIN